MKRNKKILLSLLVLTALLAVGVTLAFMFRQTEPVKNKFIDAEVACSVVETFDGEQKTSIQVRNDGNIDCYLRVRLVSYWQNKDGEIVGKASAMPQVELGEGWTAGKAGGTGDPERVYYYTKPVAAGETTETNLLKTPLVLVQEDYNGETVYQVVEVFAEAIQAEPKEAVKAAWPNFDGAS